MTDKEKIREEVERLMNELIQEKKKGFGSDADDACILELQNVLTYIDSLQEEPISEDLNTAAKAYADNTTEKVGYKLQLRRAVCFGANWQKEQMMAKAVVYEVKVDAGGYPYIPQMELYDYDKDIPLANEGDKYKVILIKEE